MVKMRVSWISTYLIALWVISLATDSCQELLLIQGPVFMNKTETRRRLTCLAEDDGSAVILNVDLEILAKPRNTPIITAPCYTTSTMSHNYDCIDLNKLGTTGDWEVVTSYEHPTRPVFDFRWEDFREYALRKTSKYNGLFLENLTQQGTVIFSARGLGAMTVKVCPWRLFDDCSGITIPARPSNASEMSTITNSSNNWQESKANTELNQPFISEYDWQTFILEWGNNMMKIQAHGSNISIQNKTTGDLETVNRMYITSSYPGRVRFHEYNYLLTKKKHIKLYSEIWSPKEQNVCIELLVSLCSNCELILNIVNSQGHHITTIGNISGEDKYTSGKLPAWRLEKRHASLSHDRLTKYIKLEFTTKWSQNATEGVIGRWAIGHWRKCPSIDAVRVSSLFTTKKWNGSTYNFPIAKCQKLSSRNTSEVRTDAANDHNTSSSLQKCLRDSESTSCQYQQSFWKNGTSFCERDGCICAPGFTGSDCEKECSAGFYGYDCRESCNHCENKACEKTTGFCNGDCLDYYLPPFCKTKLEPPAVSDVGGSTAVLRLNYSVELNMDEIRDLHFQLKTEQQDWTIPEIKSQNLSIFEATICGLAPGTRYRVRAVMQAKTAYKFWAYFESPEEDFITIGSTQPADPDPAACPTGSYDKDSNHPGISPDWSCSHVEVPSDPMNLRVISHGKGIVTLKWHRTGHTCTKIDRFAVKAIVVQSKLQKDSLRGTQQLKNCVPSQNQLKCTSDMKLYLLPSTLYNFSITAINSFGASKPAIASFQIPASVGFTSGQEPTGNRKGTFIKLRVPAVENATRNSRIEVVVKGPPIPHCDTFKNVSTNFRRLLNMTKSEDGWIAAKFNVTENNPKNLTIGKDPTNNSSGSCALDFKEIYNVIVVLEDNQVYMVRNLTPLPTSTASTDQPELIEPDNNSGIPILWIIFFFIFMICVVLLIWRRKFCNALKRIRLRNLVSYFQALANFVKSRTTSTTQQPPILVVSDNRELTGIVTTPVAVAWSRYSHSVNVEDFENYVKESLANGLLKSQFKLLPRGLIKPHKYGSLPENKQKNRYADIIAYDDTRVILEKLPDDPYSDYVNANYVQGFRKKNGYIAAQGPKPQSVVDFWRMIWQEKSRIICMLTNIIEGERLKCVQYWPDFGASLNFGDIVVVTVNHKIFADYTFRTFKVSCKNESRIIEHLHYTGWPDHSVPIFPKPVIAYLKKLQSISVENGPIIVHCSAGIGRTGTIILCDICFRRAVVEGTVDVLTEFRKLRNCRMNMVDNELQYIFAHMVLMEMFVSLPTEVECNIDLPQAIEKLKKKLPEHIERLRNTAWQDQAINPQTILRTPVPEQLAKNRFPELAPVSSRPVYLTRYPPRDTYSDYINAVIVDGVRVKKQYLASQLPLPSTLSDFWRLIAEQRIEVVIVLQQPDLNDPTCCDIIPGEEPVEPVPFIKVELTASSGPEQPARIVELLLTDTSEETPRTQRVTILTCREWEPGKNGKPPPPNELVEFWIASESIHRGEEGPTLVLCHDAVTGCGLYLALSFLLERMAVERECDIIFAVRAIRRSRNEYVQSQEQLVYLYDAAAQYFDSFKTYANFV